MENTTYDGINQPLLCPPDSIFIPPVDDARFRRCCQLRRRRDNDEPLAFSAAERGASPGSTASCICLPCPEDPVGFDEDGDEKKKMAGKCPEGQVRVLTAEGMPEVPGRCCDTYECIDHGKIRMLSRYANNLPESISNPAS